MAGAVAGFAGAASPAGWVLPWSSTKVSRASACSAVAAVMIEVKARAARSSPNRAASKRARLSPAFLALALGATGVSERRWASVSICAGGEGFGFHIRFLQALVMWAECPRVVTA